ncbi:MAG: MMPL family transporter [Spirochaetales bacterium]|nr:MMPL family transporter [Spirochaetales bacterium]
MNRFIRRILRHSYLIIIATLLITGVLGYMALGVNIDTDVNTLMPRKNARIDRLRATLGVETETTNYIFLSIEEPTLPNLTILKTFQETLDRVEAMDDVLYGLTPFNFVHFDAMGGRIVPGMMSPKGRAPSNDEELQEFRNRLASDELANGFVSSQGGKVLTAVFTTNITEDPDAFMNDFVQIIAPLEEITTLRYSGEIPFQHSVASYLTKDFTLLLILAMVAMLTIFYISFRSIRSMILPIGVVLIGAIWTMGLMAIMGFRITMVSVIIPSLILTIGSSYTIHVLNEYFRNGHGEGKKKDEWLADAVEHIFRTVIVAALTTMVSFLSLMVTRMDAVREFGLSISIGIAFCAILALFFLPSVFYVMGSPKKHHQDRVNAGRMARLVSAVGLWCGKKPWLTMGLFFVLFVSFLLSYPAIKHQSDYFSYFPSEDRIIKDTRFIIQNSGGSQSFNITITAPENAKGYFLNPEILQRINQVEERLTNNSTVVSTLSFNRIVKSMNFAISGKREIPQSKPLILLLNRYFRLINTNAFSLGKDAQVMNDDASSITIYLKLADTENNSTLYEDALQEFQHEVDEILLINLEEGETPTYWGNTMLLMDASRTIKYDQLVSTLISIVLGLIITAFFFRSIRDSFVALIPLLSGIFFYFITLFVTGIPLDMTTILVTNLTVGVGLDDAVHFMLQYRSQRKKQAFLPALESALKVTGRPIVLTTLSLVAGLMMLCFASFKPVYFFGLLISATLFSTMLGTVVFIPAALAILEKLGRRNATNA